MSRPRRRLFIRLVFVCALLLVELIFCTINFDSPNLAEIESWWAKLLRNSPSGLSWAVSTLVAAMLIGGNRLRHEITRTVEYASIQSAKPWWPFLVGHLLSFTVLALLTNVVCSEDIGHRAHADVWVLSWITCGIMTVALAGSVVLAPASWLQIFRRVYDVPALSVFLGIAACVAGRWSGEWWNDWPRLPVMWSVSQLLGLFSDEVLYRHFIIGFKFLPGGPVHALDIAALCSGYDAIGLVWIFLAAYLWTFRRRLHFPSAFLLIPLVSLVMWCAIVLRIFTLTLIVSMSVDVAVSAAHSQIAWVTFNVLALGIIVVASRMFRLDKSAVLLDNNQVVSSSYLF